MVVATPGIGPGSTSYAYDGLGNHVQQTVSGVVTDYFNDVQPGFTYQSEFTPDVFDVIICNN